MKTHLWGKGIMPTPVVEEAKPAAGKPPWEDRFSSLKAQRRAQRECFKCGDKYHQPGHKCAKSMPIHKVEELLDILMLQSGSEAEEDQPKSDSDGEASVMQISHCAAVGGTGKKTIRLQGWLNGKQVLILVDSGSSASFISTNVVEELGLTTVEVTPITVTMADGGKTTCNQMVENSVWKC